MNVLITTGTTSFISLVQVFDKNPTPHRIIAQTRGYGLSKNIKVVDYIKDIHLKYCAFDLVVTHAGAGSVYNLLELGVKCLIVPNLERSDRHQLELCNYVSRNQYAAVLGVDEIDSRGVESALEYAASYENKTYEKESFFATQYILDYFNVERVSSN